MIKTILCFILLVVGCGDPGYKDNKPNKPAPPGNANDWKGEIEGIVKEQCALSGCHAGATFVSNGGAFKASSSKQRIENGSMPKKSSPNYDLFNDEKKRKLLDYLSGN